MARSFVYNRPLDAKILLNPENPNHEFQFNTLLEIKKEVENDQLEMETDPSPEATVTNSGDLYDDSNHKIQSAVGSNQYEESDEPPHPKLVLKFRDLWRKSENSIDYPKKKKKSRGKGSKSESLTVRKQSADQRRRSEFNALSEDRITRSSLSRPSPSNSKRKTKDTLDRLQEESISDTEEKQDVWNFGRITRLNKNLNTLCESCGMCFSSDRQLQAHKRYYTADGDYHCAECDIRFSRRFQLSRHLKIAHSPIGDDETYKFKCHLCIDRFERKVSLIAHVTHLHNKQVVTHKRNTKKETIASRPHLYTRRKKKKKRSAKKSKRVRKRVTTVNPNDQETKAHLDSHLTEDSNESTGIWCKKDEQNEQSSGHQLIGDSLILNNEQANTSSTQHLINKNHSEHRKTLTPEKSDQAKATQQVQSPIKHSIEKLKELRDIQESIDTGSLNSRLQLSKKNRASPRLLERLEESSQMHHRGQTGLDRENLLPGNIQPRLRGDLVDHLGNKVGNWCVSEPFNQSNKTEQIGMANVLRYTRSNTLKTTELNSTATNDMIPATCSDQKLTQNKEMSARGRSMHAAKENYVHLHLDGVDEDLKLLPQHQQLEEEVGSVSSNQVSEKFKGVRKNLEVDEDPDLECNDFGIDLMQVDEFGETYRQTFVNYEDEEVSDSSCESISLKMAASSSNASSADSLSLDSQNVNMITSCNTQNNPKIKDLRVCLVKLENMLNLSTKNRPPKSSTLESDSLVKTETVYSDTGEEQFTDELRLWQDSRRDHDCGEKNLIQEPKPILIKKPLTLTTDPCRKVISNKNRRREPRKLVGQGISKRSEKRCFLCDAVFSSTFATASHYLSVHTEPGVLRCCLCYSNFRSLGKLRIHLFKHYRLFKKKLKSLCSLCRKEMRIPSLTRRCADCNRNYAIGQCDSRKEQFPNKQDLPEHRSTQVHVSENISLPPIERSPVSMSKEKKDSNIAVVDHESAKNDGKVVSSITCEETFKNFKCSVCDSVFFESSLLKDHVLRVHGDVDYCKYESYHNVDKLKPQTLLYSESRNMNNKTKNRCGNKNNLPKFSLGKKKHLKSKDIHSHDKLCKKKSHAQERLRSLQIKNKHERPIRQHYVRGNTKTCFDHKCDVCGLNCCCSKSLKIHKRRYLTNGNNLCNICGLTFAWKHALVMHMKTAHNPNTFHGRVRCEICNQGFYNKKFLRIHLAHFHNIKYFQCTICRIRFDSCRSLNNHRRYYSKNLSRRCRTCGQSFKCKYMLEYHKAQVHNCEKLKAYKYSCDVCNFAFHDELLLQAHIGHFHNMQDRDADCETIDPSMETENENIELLVKTEKDCIGSNASTNTSLARKHVNEINPAQGITDELVGKTIRAHTSSEYKCGLCKLSFDDPYAILNHEWEFSNDGVHVCDVCNRKFMTNSHLKAHKIKHYQRSVIRKYECYICKEDFSRLDHLKMHGVHLHGPQFVWEKNFETTNIHNRSISESRVNRDRDIDLKKISTDDTYDTMGLMASNEDAQSGKILLFKKISHNKSFVELLRRHSNEDAYCCNFCKTNFSSESLLEDHVKKHAYRAYYTNSSRYLCLICKNKFRTNDVLRAHVIHCHTSDKKQPNLSKPGCSKDAVPTERIKSKVDSNAGQTGIKKDDNKAESSVASFSSKRAIKNKPSTSEKCTGIQRSNETPPSKKRKLSNSTGEVNTFQTDRANRTLVSREVEYKTENELECNYLGGGNDKNCSELELVESTYFGITSHMESDSKSEEVELFTVIVKDAKGLQKHTCTICIETFQSVAQFREHFASVHVKNKAYLCTVCREKFSSVSDLKSHMLNHEKEPRNYVCCDKRFVSMTDFVRHKLSHEVKQSKPNAQSTSLSETGSLGEFDDQSNVKKTGNSCKCEICDKAFPDFKTMLKHWDTCIDTNGLQCDMCRARFKSLNLFRMHKMTYHEKKRNPNTSQNRHSFRLNGDRPNQASVQSSILRDNKLRRRTTIGISAEGNAPDKLERAVASANKIAKQNELLKLAKITVKPFAKASPNLKNTKEHQQTDTNEVTKPPSELRSSQGTQSSKQLGSPEETQRKISIENARKKISVKMRSNTSSPFSAVLRSAKSIEEISLLDEQVSDDVSCNANGSRFAKEQSPATSQPNPSSTVKNSSPVQIIANNSTDVGNSRIESSMLGQKSCSNDRKDAKAFNLLSTTLNADSYYLCIQPIGDSSSSMNNTGVVTSDVGQKLQSSNGSPNILSSLVQLPLNPGVSPTYFLCVKPASDSSSNCSNQTFPVVNDSKPKSTANNRTVKRLPKLLEASSSVVLNPVHASDIQRIANNSSIGKNTQNVVSNDSIIRSHLNSSKDTTILTLPATAGTSTGSKLPILQKNTSQDRNILSEKSASNKELILSKQVVRCTYCNLLFTEKVKLVKHMESHKADNQCPACGLIFSNERALQQHLPEHKCATCTKCNMITFFSDNVSPKGMKKYCSVCNTVLPSPSRKLNRSDTNSGHHVMKCGICMATFGTISQMTVHFKMVHSSFVCGVCESRFSTISSLHSHMRTHGIDSREPSQCKTCKKYFIHQLDLATHVLTH